MKRLNRNEVAKLVRDYATYTSWAKDFFEKGRNRDQNTEVEQNYFDCAFLYWANRQEIKELELAEMGIFVNREISKFRLADKEHIQSRCDESRRNFSKAKKAYDAEQEQKEMDGAVA